MSKKILILFSLIIFYLYYLDLYHSLGVFIFIILTYDFINKLGKQFIYIEILSLISWTQWIFGPVLFEKSGFKMQIPFSQYYEYAFPASILYIIGMYIPTYKIISNNNTYHILKEKIKEKIKGKHNIGIILILIGTPCWIFQQFATAGFSYIVGLLSYLLLIGICFLIFSEFKNKILYIVTSFILMISTTLINGMIGVMIFWLLILFIYSCLHKMIKISFASKTLLFITSIWLLGILQSAKTEYRNETWVVKKNALGREGKRDIRGDPSLLFNLVRERILNPSKILNKETSFLLLNRLNQGYIVSMAMKHVPQHEPFALGKITVFSTFQAFIPRLFWPQKPSIGTGEYFKKYTGIGLGKYHSATLGALGDAYVDYGKYGCFFLFLLGLSIGLIFRFFVIRSLSNPTLILWFVIIFYMTLTVSEISVPAFFNAMFKIFIYIFLIRLFLNHFFRLNV